LSLILVGEKRAADISRAADVDSLEADQLLLPKRKWQWIAVRRAAMRGNSRFLGIGQPSVRLDAAQEVAAHWPRAALGRIRPGTDPWSRVGLVGRSRALGKRGTAQTELRVAGDAGADQIGRVALAITCRQTGRRVESACRSITPKPHLVVAERHSPLLPAVIVRRSA
jgi:hypothetical protein